MLISKTTFIAALVQAGLQFCVQKAYISATFFLKTIHKYLNILETIQHSWPFFLSFISFFVFLSQLEKYPGKGDVSYVVSEICPEKKKNLSLIIFSI